MAAADFYIKEGDRSPSLLVTCVDEDGVIIDLTAAIAAKFYMINPGDTTVKVDGTAGTIVVPVTDGKLRYDWATADTDTPGDYDGEFEVEWSDGTKTTFPNFRFLRIKVTKSIETTD